MLSRFLSSTVTLPFLCTSSNPDSDIIIQNLFPPLNLTCSQSIGCLSKEFFDEFTLFQDTYPRDDLDMSRKMLENTYGVCVEPHIVEAIAHCPAPLIELMLNILPAVEEKEGLVVAADLYLRVKVLRDKLAVENHQVRMSQARHQVDIVSSYEFVLGLRPPHAPYAHSVSASPPTESLQGPRPLRIYVYEYPPDLERLLIGSPLGCSAGQWGTEVLLHRWLTAPDNPYRTLDPNEADLFYVPVYATCVIVRKRLTWEETWSGVYELVLNHLRTFQKGTYWSRYGGRDHVFLFADGQGLNQFPQYELFRESILLMVEGSCPTWGEVGEKFTDIKSCFSPWKDLIIPGHTDISRRNKLKLLRDVVDRGVAGGSGGHHTDHSTHNKTERDLLFSWRGRSSYIDSTYKQCSTRTDIVRNFIDAPKTDVGGFSKSFLEAKVRSKFCLVPGGTSPWTNHLYESIIAGCVPVILSDQYELPFWDKIDWTQVSIKWPEASADQKLYDYLEEFSQTHAFTVMQEKVSQVSCWVDWWSEDADCNPYLAIIESLSDRAISFKKLRHAAYWNVPDELTRTRRQSRYHAKMPSYILLDS